MTTQMTTVTNLDPYIGRRTHFAGFRLEVPGQKSTDTDHPAIHVTAAYRNNMTYPELLVFITEFAELVEKMNGQKIVLTGRGTFSTDGKVDNLIIHHATFEDPAVMDLLREFNQRWVWEKKKTDAGDKQNFFSMHVTEGDPDPVGKDAEDVARKMDNYLRKKAVIDAAGGENAVFVASTPYVKYKPDNPKEGGKIVWNLGETIPDFRM